RSATFKWTCPMRTPGWMAGGFMIGARACGTLRLDQAGKGLPMIGEDDEREDGYDNGEGQAGRLEEDVKEHDIHDHRSHQREAERHEASNQQQQATNDLKERDRLHISA